MNGDIVRRILAENRIDPLEVAAEAVSRVGETHAQLVARLERERFAPLNRAEQEQAAAAAREAARRRAVITTERMLADARRAARRKSAGLPQTPEAPIERKTA